jgi:hypothetical protein
LLFVRLDALTKGFAVSKLVSLMLLASLFAGVAGCSRTHTAPMRGPDGQTWVAISCRGGLENCWKTAGSMCSAGYETTDVHDVATPELLGLGVRQRGEMLVRCK